MSAIKNKIKDIFIMLNQRKSYKHKTYSFKSPN